jgi:hypothetical protein
MIAKDFHPAKDFPLMRCKSFAKGKSFAIIGLGRIRYFRTCGFLRPAAPARQAGRAAFRVQGA